MSSARPARVLLAALLLLLSPRPAAAQPAPRSAAAAPAGDARQADATVVDLEVFVQEGCPHCAAAEPWVERLRREHPDRRIRVSDVKRDPAARDRLLALARERKIAGLGTPTFFVANELIVGWDSEETTGAAVRSRLLGTAAKPIPTRGATCDTATAESPASCSAGAATTPVSSPSVKIPILGAMSADRLGLPAFSIVLGLLDGFNPCAMWTLLYLLALLAGLGSRQKMAIVGGTFIGVGGLLYFAVMAAWLEAFLFIGFSRSVQGILGLMAVTVGAINMKDFFAFKQGPTLSIPEKAKPGIYAQMRRVVTAQNLPAAILAVAVLAVLVNLFEMLCTAGFPAVFTQVLSSHQLSRPAYYGYLTIYNVGYIFDDAVMLTIAVTTLSRRRLQQREGQWLKLLSGIIMAALGVLLLVRPEWLM